MNMKLVATMLAMGALVTALPVAAADTDSIAALDRVAVTDGATDSSSSSVAFESAIAIRCPHVVSCAIGTGLAVCNAAVRILVGGSCYP